MEGKSFDPQQVDLEANISALFQHESLPVTSQTPQSPSAPQFEAVDPSSKNMQPEDKKYQAPGQKLTLLAIRLVVLQKIASAFGKLAFIWATVVLIGGMGGDLQFIDFWGINGLLLTEGIRIFSRRKEAMLKHATTQMSSLWGDIRLLLRHLEVLSALVSIAFSLLRLIQHNFNGEINMQNLANAAYLFYAMILVEASVFLIERSYWTYMISWQKLFQDVTAERKLKPNHFKMVEEFFYEVYNDCLNGNTFAGLDKDLVEFSIKKLQSDDAKEQQGGVVILKIFVEEKDKLYAKSLSKISSTPGALESLLVMITRKDKKGREVRRAAARIVKELTDHFSDYYFRIASTAGAVEGVISLLSDDGFDNDPTSMAVAIELKVLGLDILLQLSKDPKNCLNIGRSRGLNVQLVSFIKEHCPGDCREDCQECDIILKSLELLKAIASTPEDAGVCLRKDIGKTSFVRRNLQAILEHHPKLQSYAIDLLTSLALDDEIRERIGNLGEIVPVLKYLFLQGSEKEELDVAIKAGEALDLLALCSPNSKQILGHGPYQEEHNDESLDDIIKQLNKPKLRIPAAKILRRVYEHATDLQQKKISATLPSALETAMQHNMALELETAMKRRATEMEMEQEAALGLAAKVIEYMSETEFEAVFQKNKEELTNFAMKLIRKPAPSAEGLPMMRRYAVEFANGLAQKNEWFARSLKDKGIILGLQKMRKTVTTLEDYYQAFSGSMRFIPHPQPLREVIDRALDCLIFPKRDLFELACTIQQIYRAALLA